MTVANGDGRARRDDTGAMPLALLLTVVGVMVSGVLASMLMAQITGTRQMLGGGQALNAAEAGLDVATGHVRAANDASDPTGLNNAGILAALPCGPFAGAVGVGGRATYLVSIEYRDKNGTALPCVSGGGLGKTPTTALFVSVGTDPVSARTRTLNGTYTFRTTNKNIPGGLIPVYKTVTSKNLCLDAGSGAPNTGTSVTMQLCSPDSDQQTFAYNSNLTIVLVSSVTESRPLGMCLDAGAVPHTVTAPVTVQPCAASTQARQQWGFNDHANFEGTSDGLGLDGYCFNVLNPDTVGSPVVARRGASSCRQSSYNNVSSFTPEASVGAGAAAASTNQVVNYGQFGRCLDVTELNVNYKYLINWPCKQAPDPTRITWNQRWSLPVPVGAATSATGMISTTPSTAKCLKSPLSTAKGLFVTLVNCPATATSATRWTVYGNTGVYATSYTIVDDNHACLAATDPTEVPAREMYPNGLKVSPIIVVACTGSTLEKWNADPDTLKATPLTDIGEK